MALAGMMPQAAGIRIGRLAAICRGHVRYRQGRDAAARALFDDVVRADGSLLARADADAMLLLALMGLSLVRDGVNVEATLTQADAVLAAAQERDRGNLRWRRVRADLALAQGRSAIGRDVSEAAACLDLSRAVSAGLSEQNPEDPDWRRCLARSECGIGQLHAAENRWEPAVEAFARARRGCAAVAEAVPGWLVARHEAAVVEWHEGQMFEARAARDPPGGRRRSRRANRETMPRGGSAVPTLRREVL